MRTTINIFGWFHQTYSFCRAFFFREKTARSNFCFLQAVFLRRSLWIDFESPFKVGGLTKAYFGAIHWVGSKIQTESDAIKTR